jgi:hypothetical protein
MFGSVVRVKTTIELPDELIVAAKPRAAELRRGLRTLIERGVRHELLGGTTRPRKRRGIRRVTVRGGLPPGLDARDRAGMHAWLRRRS